jgi:hypothetical protein
VARVLPPGERQRTVDPFPALAGITPARDPEQTLDVALDVLRQAQLEQVWLRARLELTHDAVRPEPAIATHHLRFLVGGQFIDDPEQTGQRVAARVLVARLDLDPYHQAQPGHQVGVVTV